MNIDREIAEKVMGWHTDHVDVRYLDGEDNIVGSTISWLPHKNISQAMEVEAEMIATHKFAIRITRLTPHPDLEAPNWTVEFMRHENLERIHVEEHANTLPEAICLAALSAIK